MAKPGAKENHCPHKSRQGGLHSIKPHPARINHVVISAQGLGMQDLLSLGFGLKARQYLLESIDSFDSTYEG